MAIFYPSIDDINNDKMEMHTKGELKLLKILSSLDDTYNVYYQPHINIAHPDIIIEKKSCGILIIEVKDWNLDSYTFTSGEGKYGYLTVNGSSAKLSTPFEQVQEYKDEMFDVLSQTLYIEKIKHERFDMHRIKSSPVYGIVRTAVFFSMSDFNNVIDLFSSDDITINGFGYKQYKKYITIWTREDENNIVTHIRKILCKSNLYTQLIHDEIASLFSPSAEWLEQTKPFTLSDKQSQLAACCPGQRLRIRGGAGSGKTLILSQKAINCFKEKKTPVLILTFNITLKNYIRDKIAANTRGMSQRERNYAFEIVHFDSFLSQMIRKYGIKSPNIVSSSNEITDWDDIRKLQMDVLEDARDRIERYDTILIDEAQDYKSIWFSFIERNFLASNADFLVVADEKQNIYDIEIDNVTKMPCISGFSGPWKVLKENYRLSTCGMRLADAFQHEFFSEKYHLETIQQLDIFIYDEKHEYLHFDHFDAYNAFDVIQRFMKSDPPISPNDVCILSTNCEKIRLLDKVFRDKHGRKSSQTICETQEIYYMLQRKYGLDEFIVDDIERKKRRDEFNKELDKIRNMKKNAFNMNSGCVKMCTVHSFKGWEINTIILIIDEQQVNDEIIYTAITRSKQNLLILDYGNNRYKKFFETEFSKFKS